MPGFLVLIPAIPEIPASQSDWDRRIYGILWKAAEKEIAKSKNQEIIYDYY